MLLRLIFHEITGSVPAFCIASTSPRLTQSTADPPGFLSEAFLVSEHPPDKGVSSEEGRASDDVGLRKGVRLEK